MGDMPYNKAEKQFIESQIAPAIKHLNPQFLIHYGDLLPGHGAECSDKTLLNSRDQIFSLNRYRTFYTPGDNDWTDCDRESSIVRYDELDRLKFLRKIFYQNPNKNFTKNIDNIIHQNGLVENAIWNINNVHFSTIHLVSTNNGRKKILKIDLCFNFNSST